MASPIADIEGKYEILSKLSEGGMGAIYQVRHRLLEEIRVVKVLRQQHAEDDELRHRFAREARAAIKLRHPNVVQIFDFSVDEEGNGLIVMENIEGIDFEKLVRSRHEPSMALGLELARQALRSLGFLHQHGFVHRDVSPDNLMLTLDVDRRPLVKLIDLGIAKRVDAERQLTTRGSFLGKFRYASPEHFGAAGHDGIEARSDLYSFGVVLYELLTGQFPMPAETTSQLIAAHLMRPPRDFTDTDPQNRLPDGVRQMLLRALAKGPDERYQDAASWIAALDELRAALDEQDVAEEARRWLQEAPREKGQAPGSATQGRFDHVFGMETTPRPTSGIATVPEPAEAPGADLDALVSGARTLFELGHTDAARRQVKTLLGIAPDHPEATQLLKEVDAGTLADELAEEIAEKAESSKVLEEVDALEDALEEVAVDDAEEEPEAAGEVPEAEAEAEAEPDEEPAAEEPETEPETGPEEAREEEAGEEEPEADETEDDESAEAESAEAETTEAEPAEAEPAEAEPADDESAEDESAEDEASEEADEKLKTEIAEIERLIDEGHLTEADRHLFQLAEEFPDASQLGEVQEHLKTAFDGDLESELHALLEDAEAKIEDDDYPAALELIQKAEIMAPEEPDARRRILEGVARLKDEIEARERRRGLGQIEQHVFRRLQSGDLSGLRDELTRAKASYGESDDEAQEALDHLGRLVERTVRDRLGAYVAEAGVALEAGRMAAAVSQLRDAVALAPDDPWISRQLASAEEQLEAQRAQDEADASLVGRLVESEEADGTGDDDPAQAELPPNLVSTLASIEQLRQEGETIAAWKKMQKALERFGEIEVLLEARRSLAESILDKE